MSEYETMTKEQKEYFEYGAKRMLDYILFCVSDYQYKLNLAGIKLLLEDVSRFCEDCDLNIHKSYFRNTLSGIGFKDFVGKDCRRDK